MICVKTIITLLYPHLLATIPPTYDLPTLALLTPAPVASGFYFAPGAPVANLNQKASSVGVQVANGLPEWSVTSATLALVPSLPPAAMQGHVMPSFPRNLIGLGSVAELSYSIVFTKTAVNVIDLNGHSVLEGWWEQDGP